MTEEDHINPYTWDEPDYEAFLTEGQPRLNVYTPPETVVVLGRGSRVDVEVRAEAVRADGVPLLKRRGGGCAVVLDPGNVVVSVYLPVKGIGNNHSHFERLTAWLIAGLESVGVMELRHDGISDLVYGDRKVGGSCIYRTKGLLFYSTTILVDPDIERVERYLHHPPREPEYRAGRAHRDFMGGLASTDWGGTVVQLRDALRNALDVDDISRRLRRDPP